MLLNIGRKSSNFHWRRHAYGVVDSSLSASNLPRIREFEMHKNHEFAALDNFCGGVRRSRDHSLIAVDDDWPFNQYRIRYHCADDCFVAQRFAFEFFVPDGFFLPDQPNGCDAEFPDDFFQLFGGRRRIEVFNHFNWLAQFLEKQQTFV